jgi:two-component system, OmpR family, response regulator MtrA
VAIPHVSNDAPMSIDHRIVVVARDRHIGTLIADDLEGIGLKSRGPISPADAQTRAMAYAEQGIAVLLLVVDQDCAAGLDLLNFVRNLAGVALVAYGRISDPRDVAALLDAGAGDVIREDCALVEIVARLRRSLVSVADTAGATLVLGDMVIDLARRGVRRGEQVLNLTRTEFDLLVCLSRRMNRVVPAPEIFREVLGYPSDGDTHVLTVHVQRLRNKVELDPSKPALIKSVRGIGYMLIHES